MASVTYTFQYVENYGRPVVPGLESVIAPPVAAEPKPLPKPARVEKWQRWHSPIREYVVTGVSEHASIDERIVWARSGKEQYDFIEAMLISGQCAVGWSFLGYAKPDKVEVGQRWHQTGFGVRTVAALECGDKQAKFTDGGALPCRTITENTMMEYLGMADGAELDARATTGEALDREAKRNEFVRSDGETDERLRARFSMPRDPKIEARRTNEEAAKRLIANPPEWAYPRAWTCAVLAEVETSRDVAYQLNCDRKTGAATLAIKDYHFARLAGKTHEAAMLCVELNHHIVEVYARGMEKPAGLMGRPGVKGGMSTCDLGGEYE